MKTSNYVLASLVVAGLASSPLVLASDTDPNAAAGVKGGVSVGIDGPDGGDVGVSGRAGATGDAGMDGDGVGAAAGGDLSVGKETSQDGKDRFGVSASGDAAAGETDNAEKPTQITNQAKTDFKTLDKDANGYLTQDEVASADVKMNLDFKTLDSDSDGRVKASEYSAYVTDSDS